MVFLRGPSYVLGEREADHTEIGNLEDLATKYTLTMNAKLWGWGRIHTTCRELEDLAADAAVGGMGEDGPGVIR